MGGSEEILWRDGIDTDDIQVAMWRIGTNNKRERRWREERDRNNQRERGSTRTEEARMGKGD